MRKHGRGSAWLRTVAAAVALAGGVGSVTPARASGSRQRLPEHPSGAGDAVQGDRAPLHGYVREADTGEPVVLAEVTVTAGQPSLTDRQGYFVGPTLPAGPTLVRVAAYGYALLDTLVVVGGGPVTLELARAPIAIEALLVRLRHAHALGDLPDPGVRLVGHAEMEEVPVALQADAMRSLQALPGVVAASPVSSRIMVRGGGPDENQLLLDGFPILYPYHLAGAFSAFDMSAVQDVEFWAGAAPARYGGHLSSVVDVALREGNRERPRLEASIGPVTSGAEFEGPVPGGAYMVATRRTYVDALARIPGGRYPYHFWDVTAKAHADLTASDRLTWVGFYGRDRLFRDRQGDSTVPGDVGEDEDFRWANGMTGLSWRHLFGGRAVLRQRLSRSVFSQRLGGARTPGPVSAAASSEHHAGLTSARGELDILGLPAQALRFGYELSRQDDHHEVRYTTQFLRRGIETESLGSDAGASSAVAWLEDEVSAGRATLRLGVRAEQFDSRVFIQPRLAVAGTLHERVELHGWWGEVTQYEHVLQDPDLDLTSLYSLDVWLPSADSSIAVGRARQAGLGTEVELGPELSVRADLFSRRMRGLYTIPDASDADARVAIKRIEPASARARGLEVTLRRTVPEGVSGWLGYSYLDARTETVTDTYPMTRQPRNRALSVLGWTDGRWRMNARLEVFEGLPYTPALASYATRPYDFGDRHVSSLCSVTGVEFLYGETHRARTGLSKRLDLSARYSRETRRGWMWEVGFALYNALFDPPGIFRPDHPPIFPPDACEAAASVGREPELQLPAIPSITFRIRF